MSSLRASYFLKYEVKTLFISSPWKFSMQQSFQWHEPRHYVNCISYVHQCGGIDALAGPNQPPPFRHVTMLSLLENQNFLAQRKKKHVDCLFALTPCCEPPPPFQLHGTAAGLSWIWGQRPRLYLWANRGVGANGWWRSGFVFSLPLLCYLSCGSKSCDKKIKEVPFFYFL